jgi:hypothetical protein
VSARARTAATVAVLLAATWAVDRLSADDEVIVAPMVVRAHPGERAVGRNISAVVLPERQQVRTATELALPDGTTVATPGLLIVVPVRVSAVVEPASLRHAELVVDGVRHTAVDDRLGHGDLTNASLSPGIDTVGQVIFEVAPTTLDGATAVRLEIATTHDPRLDSLVTVTLPTPPYSHDAKADLTRVTRHVP